MRGTGSGKARRPGRATHALTAAGLWAGAVATVALAVSGAFAPAEARRKITPPDVPPALASAAPASSALFGAAGKAHPPARNFAKWNEVLARYERERKMERADCRRGECALVRWREFLGAIRHAPPMIQLKAVNDYLNRIAYVADIENYGAEDFWATPRQFFAKGGDCEDYAIAKYFSLRALGWPAERLRVVVVNDLDRDLVHAALVVYHGGTGYVLDIEIPEVTDQRKVARYKPIFAIAETGWWSFDVPAIDTVRAVRAATKPVVAEGEAKIDAAERTEEIFAPGAK